MGWKKTVLLVAVAAVVALALILAVGFGFFIGRQGQPKEPASPAQIDELQMDSDGKAVSELKGIIKGKGDDYTRERAVLALADIAGRTGAADDTIPFLKEVALNDGNTDVRTAAYVAIRDLRRNHTSGLNATLTVRVAEQAVAPGNFTLEARVTVNRDAPNTQVYIKRISRFRNEGDEDMAYQIVSQNPVKLNMKADVEKKAAFTVTAMKPGDYLVVIAAKADLDTIDYVKTEQKIYVHVD